MPKILLSYFLTGGIMILLLTSLSSGGSLPAPPGMFKDLTEEIVKDALVINGKQLFIDDYIIEELKSAKKNLNQPVKHQKNPLIVPDQPWDGDFGYSSVIFDREEGFFKMWYGAWAEKKQALCYATSPDGIAWRKPVTTPWEAFAKKESSNIVFGQIPAFNCATVFKDPIETNPDRRYKMLYSDYPDGTAKTASTSAAYSPDGIHWTPYPENPLIPFSDSHNCPFWDVQRQRYAAYLRYGPPNARSLSLVESEDFVHWSPKITILWQGQRPIDSPFDTKLYSMEVMPYEKIYMGFVSTYHGETIQPIPKDKEAWMDKVNVQLAFSRNGRTWLRVGKQGAIPDSEYSKSYDWKTMAEEATFLPYGEHGKEWDWGSIYPLQAPLVVRDEIWIYYTGASGRHWASYHGDTTKTGIGLATLRLDGFVSVEPEGEAEGILTTKPLVFVGDTIVVNADASAGSLAVEAIDDNGKVIEGFSREDCTPITTDNIRHIIKWKGNTDCYLLQARPIKLRFYLKKAKLYSFEPRIFNKHYVPSYD